MNKTLEFQIKVFDKNFILKLEIVLMFGNGNKHEARAIEISSKQSMKHISRL